MPPQPPEPHNQANLRPGAGVGTPGNKTYAPMDNLTTNSIFAGLVGAIAVLFRLLVGHYDTRIKNLEAENAELRSELHQRRVTDTAHSKGR